MENIEDIKSNTPIILFFNKEDQEKYVSVNVKNVSKDKQCFVELFIESGEERSRSSIFRRMLNVDEDFNATSYPVCKDEKYIAIVSHCQVSISVS